VRTTIKYLALLISLIYLSGSHASASANPGLNEVIADHSTDPGIRWAHEYGFIKPIGKSVTSAGRIITVEGVMADATRTIIFLSLTGSDEKEILYPPMVNVTYNAFTNPYRGFGAEQWKQHGARLVGSISLAPLPLARTLVRVNIRQTGGVNGDRRLNFVASRSGLDRASRTVKIGQQLQGDGYHFLVDRAIITPSTTSVVMTGDLEAGVELPRIDVLVDGQKLSLQGNGPTREPVRKLTFGSRPMRYIFTYEPVHQEMPLNVVLQPTNTVRWIRGGPDLDLRQPGGHAVVNGMVFKVVRVTPRLDATIVDVTTSGGDFQTAWSAFRNWTLVDSAGTEYPLLSSAADAEHAVIRFVFASTKKPLAQLVARERADNVPSGSKLGFRVP
jgi:hypothetical protein